MDNTESNYIQQNREEERRKDEKYSERNGQIRRTIPEKKRKVKSTRETLRGSGARRSRGGEGQSKG